MANSEIKLELIQWLTNLKDQSILNALTSIKNSYISDDWSNELTAKQKQSILKGEEDHQKGRTITDQEFWTKYGR